VLATELIPISWQSACRWQTQW